MIKNGNSNLDKVKVNSITSFLKQIVAFACGFILPKAILSTYGSSVNGLINSITQFLQVISFLQLGIGVVVQASLYKAFAEKDSSKVNEIMTSTSHFFHILATIFAAYTIILAVLYPHFITDEFEKWYITSLVFILAIGSFADYCFGIVDGILLTADQRAYIQYILIIITQIINTIVCVLLIRQNYSIQSVKLISSMVYLIRPILQRLYIKKHYSINRRVHYEQEPISQKWNGIAQHVAHYVLTQTDIIVLTIFDNLKSVSIYSVYYMILIGIKSLSLSITYSLQNMMGKLWAEKNYTGVNKYFEFDEWLTNVIVTITFGCSSVLIVDFIRIYTVGLHDANYIVPQFAWLITLATALDVLGNPYMDIIYATGHFKQTQNCFIIAAVINVLTSIVLVKRLQLIGVAIGTIISMAYQLIWLLIYVTHHGIRWRISKSIKNFAVDIIISFSSYYVSQLIKISCDSYFYWFFKAMITLAIWSIISILCNSILYSRNMKKLLSKL